MADTLKTLGQAALSATTLTDIYTVPASTSTTISSVVICNRGTATTFRLAMATGGATDDPKQYLYYDQAIDANSTFIATVGLTMASTDVLRAYAASGNVSVNIFGVEVF